MKKSFTKDNFDENNFIDEINNDDIETKSFLDKKAQETMNELAEKIINSNDKNEKNNLLFFLTSIAEQAIHSGYCARYHKMNSLLTEKTIAQTVLANFTGKYFEGTRKSLIYDPKKQYKQVRYVPWFRMTLRWNLDEEFKKEYKNNNYIIVSHKCSVCDEKYCINVCEHITYKDKTNSIAISKSCDGCGMCINSCPKGYLIRKSVNSPDQSLDELKETLGDTTDISTTDNYFKEKKKVNADNKMASLLLEFINFVVGLFSSQDSDSKQSEWFNMFFSCTLVNILKHDAEIDYKNDNGIPISKNEIREKLDLEDVIDYINDNETVVLKNCDMAFMHYIINNNPQTVMQIMNFLLKNYGDIGIDTKGMAKNERIELPIKPTVQVVYWMNKTKNDNGNSVKSEVTTNRKIYLNKIYNSLRPHISEEKQYSYDILFNNNERT